MAFATQLECGGTTYDVKDAMAEGGFATDNAFDYAGMCNPANGTNAGVTFTRSGNKYTCVGTVDGASAHHELYRGALPCGMKVGDTLWAIYKSTKAQFSIYFFNADWSTRIQAYWLKANSVFTVPSGAVNLILWLLVESEDSPVNETVEPILLSNKASLINRDITPYIKTDSQGQYVDLNDLEITGLYIMDTSLRKLHAPENVDINTVEVYNISGGGFAKQVAYSITRDTSQNFDRFVYTRNRKGDGWRNTWVRKASRFDQDVMNKSLKSYNVYDLLYEYVYFASYDYPTATEYGITFSTNVDGSVHVEGTLNAGSAGLHTAKVQYYYGALPDGFVPSSQLFVKMDSATGKVTLRIYFYDANWSSETRVAYFLSQDATINVPSIAANMIIWLGVEGEDYITVNETVHPKILTKAVSQQVTNYNTFNYTVHNDSYTLNASPAITAVSDYYLAPTGTTADRTADIEALLQANKVCRLGAGDYYITQGIDMPDGSTLIGSGRQTRLILSDSVTEGYVISVGSYCTVQDLRVCGLASGNLPYEEFTLGSRDGIVQLGDYVDFQTPATFSANYDKLSNLWIDNFTGSGIRSYRNDGAASFLANNIDIFHCGVGVNIELFSEFHAWNNIRCRWCVYACIMNGGNNLFSNCHWDVCIHLLKIDNSLGNLVNDTHSSFTNCTFCHANSNTGIAIEMINVQNGVVFSNCQIFYSKIVLTDTKGVVLNGFNFGGGENIILTRCRGINISNCIFGTPPVVTKDDVQGLIWTNNMTRAGMPISAP